MKILHTYIILFFIFNQISILLNCSQNFIEILPLEIKNLIVQFVRLNYDVKYNIQYPTVKNSVWGYGNSIDLISVGDRENYYKFNEQCLLKNFPCTHSILELSNDTENLVSTFLLPYYGDYLCTYSFDGPYHNNTAVFTASTKGTSFIYYLSICNSQPYTNNKELRPILQIAGLVYKIVLDPEKNTFAYAHSVSQFNDYMAPKIYSFTIANIQGDLTAKTISINTSFPLSNIIYLGNQTYFGLTNGNLIVFWQQNDGSITYAMQKHASQFFDIAVDNTVKTKKGFCPHVAFLTLQREIFVCNILAFFQPTLFFLKKINEGSYDCQLLYNKGKCGVLYSDRSDPCNTHLELYPDNLQAFLALKS